MVHETVPYSPVIKYYSVRGMSNNPATVRRAMSDDLSRVLALVEALLTELGEEGDEAGELAVDH